LVGHLFLPDLWGSWKPLFSFIVRTSCAPPTTSWASMLLSEPDPFRRLSPFCTDCTPPPLPTQRPLVTLGATLEGIRYGLDSVHTELRGCFGLVEVERMNPLSHVKGAVNEVSFAKTKSVCLFGCFLWVVFLCVVCCGGLSCGFLRISSTLVLVFCFFCFFCFFSQIFRDDSASVCKIFPPVGRRGVTHSCGPPGLDLPPSPGFCRPLVS